MRKTFRFFYQIAWTEKPSYVLLLVLSILLNAVHPFVNLFLSKYVLEELIGSRRVKVLLLLTAALVLGNFVLLACIHVVKCALAKYDDWFNRHLYDMLGRKSMTMAYALTESPEALNQCRKADEGIAFYSGGMKGLSECVQQLFSYLLTFAGVVAIVALRTPVLLVVAVFAVIGGSVAVWQTNKCYQIEFEVFPKANRSFGYMTRNVLQPQYSKSIRLYGAAGMMKEQFMKTMNRCATIFRYTAVKIGRWNCIGSVVNFLKNLCIYGYLGYKLVTGAVSLGDFTLLSGSANTLKDSLQGILNQIQDLQKKLKFMGEYVCYLEMEDTTQSGTLLVENEKLPVIEFKNVSFKYPLTEEYVLKNVSIEIPAGQHLSVVGLNGAGKTTFIKLLCRLYDVEEGEILLNGINIREYDYDSYMKELAVVFQDFKLFALSIRENIELGDSEKTLEKENKDASEAENVEAGKVEAGNAEVMKAEAVRRVMELAGLTELIRSLPKGMDTQVYKVFDKEGIEPSGGELQKMAIARALYKDAPIVILDEPTAALDPVAEYEVYSHFNDLVGGKTAIYISHRLSSCKFSDRIAVFADKTIKEYGTHEELVAKDDGIYAAMFATQAKYYV